MKREGIHKKSSDNNLNIHKEINREEASAKDKELHTEFIIKEEPEDDKWITQFKDKLEGII